MILDPQRASVARPEDLAFGEAVRRGVCVEPPNGVPAIESVIGALAQLDADLFVVVEQDLYPCAPGAPLPIAIRTREYLRRCGLGGTALPVPEEVR